MSVTDARVRDAKLKKTGPGLLASLVIARSSSLVASSWMMGNCCPRRLSLFAPTEATHPLVGTPEPCAPRHDDEGYVLDEFHHRRPRTYPSGEFNRSTGEFTPD